MEIRIIEVLLYIHIYIYVHIVSVGNIQIYIHIEYTDNVLKLIQYTNTNITQGTHMKNLLLIYYCFIADLHIKRKKHVIDGSGCQGKEV